MANKISRWLTMAVGEISKLRVTSAGVSGTSAAPYALNSSDHVDYGLARDLYYNRNDAYKLGAGFAKPVINTLAGFMGTPEFRADDDRAQEALDTFCEPLASLMQRVHQKTLIDGECFVRLVNLPADITLYPEATAKTRLECIIIPPEQVSQILLDPVTRDCISLTISTKNQWTDESGNKQDYTYTQTITKTRVVTVVDGAAPPGVTGGTDANSWGFVPVVHFRNEPDETELHGYSELEPIEPFLKAYHDVMLHAITGSKMHSTPKIAFKLANVSKFLQNNFPSAIKALEEGKPATIRMDGKELFLLDSTDDAGFIECKSAIGDTATLLQFLFYCIVDNSEMPEFAFGVHIASAQASTKEQGPILIRRIKRKREQVEDAWLLFARMALAMLSKTSGAKYASYATTVEWGPVLQDEQADALTLYNIAQALTMAVTNNIMSAESASNYLSRYVDTMSEWEATGDEPGELAKIEQTKILNSPIEEAYTQQRQVAQINKELGDEQ